MKPTQKNLKLFCEYDPITGIFKRIGRLSWKGNFIKCEYVPIIPSNFGYYQLNIFGRPYAIHRLIFLYVNGVFPEHDVDHINGDRIDNRWCNLREVTRRENMMNVGVRSNSSTGVTGVTKRKDTGRYQVYIDVNGTRVRHGCYDTLEEAKEVRRKATIDNGFHPNHGERKR